MLEYSLIKQHRPRFNVRLRDDKSYPFLAITLDEEWPRAMVVRGRKRKGVRYFGPYAHAYAIRDTLDLLLRSFPIRTCSPSKYHQHHRLGRPCLLFHIEKCSGPCVGGDRPRRVHATRPGADRLPRRRHRRHRQAPRPATCARRPTSRSTSGRPACGTASPRCSKAIAKQQMVADRNEDLDVIGIAAGRPRGRGPGVLRPPRAGGRAEGLHPRQGGGPRRARAGRPHPGGALRRRAPARRAEAGAAARRARGPGRVRGVAGHPAPLPGRHPRPAPGRQARAARHGDPQREGGVHPPPPAPGQRPQQPGPGDQRAAGPAGPARGAAAHRVLRHGPPPGDRLRRLDGGDGGRPAQEERLPPLQGEGGRRQRRLRRHGGGADPPPHRLPGRAGPPDRRAGRAARPLLLPAAAPRRRRRQGPAGRGRAGGAQPRPGGGDPAWRRWPSASRRCTSPDGPTRSTSPASPRRCSCCNGCGTRPTASPTPSTASCGASA